MVRYVIMKRITQILASVLFVITVLTVYLAFDFAINNAVSNKNSSHKRSLHHHHDNPSDDIKITKRRSVSPSLLPHTRRSNRTMNHSKNHEHSIHKIKQQQTALRAKPGHFHKGKTGVKVNKPQNFIKDRRKRSTTTTMASQYKDKHHLDDKRHD